MQKIYIRRFLRREMTEVIELSEDNFEKNIAKGKWVVDFWAEWCGPCKILSPAVEAAAKEMKGKVHFGKVNVDAEGELAQRFEVMSIPTLIFFNDGKLLDRTSGAMDEDELKNIIEKVF
jgi:thioredoxin 1